MESMDAINIIPKRKAEVTPHVKDVGSTYISDIIIPSIEEAIYPPERAANLNFLFAI